MATTPIAGTRTRWRYRAQLDALLLTRPVAGDKSAGQAVRALRIEPE